MKKMQLFLLFWVVVLSRNMTLAQSRAELRARIETLERDKAALEDEKEELVDQLDSTIGERNTLSTKLNRIADIEVDDVITAEEQPSTVKVGDAGWRVELNGTKYKSDLIGQLGTIWVNDTNSQLQPQGGISLAEYSIEPELINPDKETLYKKFVSKGTKMDGEGGVSFVKISGSLSTDQYSYFTINIEGTSLIKPKYADLKKIAAEVEGAFDFPGGKGVFICTGMHVIKYHSSVYSKNSGDAQINSPVVNIGGEFYAESSEESSEYLVVRQLTQLFKPSKVKDEKVDAQLSNVSKLESEAKIAKGTKKYSPQEVLSYILQREPTFEEIAEFQSDPIGFLDKRGEKKVLTSGDEIIIKETKEKIVDLPQAVKSNKEEEQQQ